VYVFYIHFSEQAPRSWAPRAHITYPQTDSEQVHPSTHTFPRQYNRSHTYSRRKRLKGRYSHTLCVHTLLGASASMEGATRPHHIFANRLREKSILRRTHFPVNICVRSHTYSWRNRLEERYSKNSKALFRRYIFPPHTPRSVISSVCACVRLCACVRVVCVCSTQYAPSSHTRIKPAHIFPSI